MGSTTWVVKSLSPEESEQIYCPKCTDPMFDRFRLEPCCHISCASCISNSECRTLDFRVQRLCPLCQEPVTFISVLPQYPTAVSPTTSTSYLVPNGSVSVVSPPPKSQFSTQLELPPGFFRSFGIETCDQSKTGMCLCCPMSECQKPHFKWFSSIEGLSVHLRMCHATQIAENIETWLNPQQLIAVAKPQTYITLAKIQGSMFSTVQGSGRGEEEMSEDTSSFFNQQTIASLNPPPPVSPVVLDNPLIMNDDEEGDHKSPDPPSLPEPHITPPSESAMELTPSDQQPPQVTSSSEEQS